MGMIYKEVNSLEVVNSTVETTLFTFDFDRHSELFGGFPLGPNQAVRITCIGGILENNSGLSTPNAYYEFHFGNLQVDQIVYADDWHFLKATFDLVLGQGNSLLYSFQYVAGDNAADPGGDSRVGGGTGTYALDVSSPLTAMWTVKLSGASVNLKAWISGYYIEAL